MEESIVYFANLRATKHSENKVNKIKSLCSNLCFENIIKKKDIVAIKVHFGEVGNDSYINPIYVRTVVDLLKNNETFPFVTDTNTLYNGKRSIAPNHIETALRHGFNYTVINAPVIIADGIRGKNESYFEINKKHFQFIKIAQDIKESDSMIVLSHFKGHSMAGFGGSLKNLAMGCASKFGKYEQHVSAKPTVIKEKCIGCKKCIEECSTNSIKIINKKAEINKNTCNSCGYCLLCKENAIAYNYSEITDFIEKMMEYSYGIVKQKKNKIGYINFLINVSPDCDCVSWTDSPIIPDIGILGSLDPVALDQACYDLVNKSIGLKNSALKSGFKSGDNKFYHLNPNINSEYQLEYAEKLKIGNRKYKLIEI